MVIIWKLHLIKPELNVCWQTLIDGDDLQIALKDKKRRLHEYVKFTKSNMVKICRVHCIGNFELF